MSTTAELPEDVKRRVGYLRQSYDAHIATAKKLSEADEGRMFGIDLVVLSTLNRSLSLVDGFALMIETRNIMCAGALLRLQLDSLMRLYAFCLVEDPNPVLEQLLRGDPLHKLKSRSGNELTDGYLHKELSRAYGEWTWINSVYDATSGFVHLSKPHMLSMVNYIEEKERQMLLVVSRNARQATPGQLLEATEAFIAATKCLLHLSGSWLVTKENVAAERNGQEQSSESESN